MDEAVYQQLYDTEERHWWFRGRRAVMWALLGRAGLPDRPRILDAGCGTGRNLVEFGALGPVRGVDPSASAIEYCRRRGFEDVVRSGVESLPFDDDSFDLIIASDVIEHIDDDSRALAELRRVAATDARLLLTVPAYQWLWSEHDDSHHHFRRYTLRRLRRRVAEAGWRPLVDTYFNSLLLPPIALVRGLGRLAPRGGRSDYDLAPSALKGALGLPMRAEAAAIARGVRLPAGVSVGMVCSPAIAVPATPTLRPAPVLSS